MVKIVFNSLKWQTKSLFFWSLGVVAMVALLIAFYPSVKESALDLQSYFEKLPEGLKAFVGEAADYASPVGYLNSELFAFMMPLLMIIFTVSAGSGTIAGEEEDGTLDVLLANPVPRWQVVVEKFFTLFVSSSTISLITALAIVLGAPLVDMTISSQRVFEMMISVELIAMAFGSISLFLGIFTGKRSISISLTAALAIVSFFLNALAPTVDFLNDFQKFSPFYHYNSDNPLKVGLGVDHVAVLAGMILLFFVLSILTFQRRDLRI